VRYGRATIAISVVISGHPEHTTEYVWGPKTIKTIRCNGCGGVTHWEPIESQQQMQIGVNMRNFEPRELDNIRIRRFDGADTWSFLDE